MNEYVTEIYYSKKVKKYLGIICKDKMDLREDLFYFCISKIIEMDKDDLDCRLLKSKKSVVDYFIGMAVFNINSNTSEFFKIYRNHGFTKSFQLDEDYNNWLDIEDSFDIEDRILRDKQKDILLKRVKEATMLCDPINLEIFKKFYYDDMNKKDIAEYYSMTVRAVVRRLNKIKLQLRGLLK